MRIDWAMLCHDIQKHEGGGLTIVGVFTRLLVDRLPATVSPLNVAIRFIGDTGERATCRITILDPDGNELKTTPTESVHLPHGIIDASVPFSPVSIKRQGPHTIVIYLDDLEARRFVMPVQIVTVA